MNISNNTKKNIEIGVLFGLIAAILLSMARFDAACDDMRNNILRVHIKANSDSEYDQQLKLKVRDAILEESLNCFEDCKNLEDAAVTADLNKDNFESVANRVLYENGADYTARISVEDCDFDTRVYDDFTLPAGNYRALKIDLGKAEGKNWWCVVFPGVCVPAASDAKLTDTISEKSASIAENAPKYRMKFKIVEIYESLKKKFR